MKNKLNILLLSSFLLSLTIAIWVYYQITHSIGDIAFNSKIDDDTFMVCNEHRIFQYYSVGTSYIGERKALREEIFKELENKNLKLENKSGYITFRFVINCKNKAGIFRVKMVDSDLKENNFTSNNIKHIQESIKSLNGWKAAKFKDEYVDSYYQINFKIQNGKITDIF